MLKWLNIKQPEPLRYFRSDFLERFTFFRLRTIWLIWAPIATIALFASFFAGGRSMESSGFLTVLATVLATVLLGLLRWTLLEYFLHRFLFHYDGPNELRRKISWYVHGIHHDQAMLSSRLVAPPPFSLGIGLIIGLLDWLILGLLFRVGWIGLAFFSGTAYGYLIYDTLHWSVHFIDSDWPWYRKLRRHHMRHHRSHHERFGVSNTLWDHVFRTYPKSNTSNTEKKPKLRAQNSPGKSSAGSTPKH